MTKCDKCGINLPDVVHRVRNYYPEYGFPHDTENTVCLKCKRKFEKYISKKYNDFFTPYDRFIPCKCGCNRHHTWNCMDLDTGKHFVKIVCEKCETWVSGKNKADAKRNWNKIMSEEVKS